MKKKRIEIRLGALPYKREGGRLYFMLTTARATGRWIIPKGRPEKGVKPHRQAAIEAKQETGVRGVIAKQPFGSYDYKKREGEKRVPCRVIVYPLKIQKEFKKYKESGQRKREYMLASEAAKRVQEKGLKGIMLQFGRARSRVTARRKRPVRLRRFAQEVTARKKHPVRHVTGHRSRRRHLSP